MKKVIVISFFMLFIAGYSAVTEENTRKTDFLKKTGFIFNTDNILLDIEGYLGGVGFKYRGESWDYRTMVDFSLSSSKKKFNIGTDLALEKHFRSGKISPYWGPFFHAAYETEKFESDANNWSKLIQYPLSAGALLGVEVFIMDFLSFFVEYNLSLEIVGVTNQQDVAGVVTESTTWNYNLFTGIGNNSKLGIVIYLDDVVDLEKKTQNESKGLE